MTNDAEIAHNVVEELRWTPELDDKDIAVKVTDGVVTLTGFVSTLLERAAAERAAKRVVGVRALANDLEVRPLSADLRSDPDLARAAADIIERELPHSARSIRITVRDGKVTLEGCVDWAYQKTRAGDAIASLRGVRGISNLIALKGKPVAADIRQQITAAFKRSAQIDADNVNVEINGNEVTLTGKVHSWTEREAAAEVAWCAPGVMHVKNHICVGP
ncbi:MAG TPA: BON domain-containing protein [Steroidobacteraceae bacterium]|nr:BON domain-containing protein [Steroidobacteraceae bacterium]